MFARSEFGKNVMKVMTGTTAAQVFPFLVAPILSRIYTPEEFGAYYLLGAMIAILVPTVTGRYELAILIPKKNDAALNLAIGSLGIASLLSLFLLCLLFGFKTQISTFFENPDLKWWLLLVPLAVFIQSWQNVASMWHNRQKRFGQLTIARFLMAGFNAGGRVGLGFLMGGVGGLLIGTIMGWAIGLIFLLIRFFQWDFSMLSKFDSKIAASQLRRFQNFPRSMVVGTLFNKSAFELPSILLNKFFESSIAGYFGQTQAIIRRPLQIIGRAFEEVFKQKASEELHEKGHCRSIFYLTFRRLSLIGFLPFLLLFFIAPPLFAFVLGPDWRVAGEYAQVFALPYFFQFVLAPLSSIFYLKERTVLYTILEFIQACLVLGGLATGALVYKDPKVVMLLMAGGYTISYILRFLFLSRIIKGTHQIKE